MVIANAFYVISQSKEGESSSDEEADDETMMALDKNIAALFSERKKRLQAAKDKKEKMMKEKALRKNFKIKVYRQNI